MPYLLSLVQFLMLLVPKWYIICFKNRGLSVCTLLCQQKKAKRSDDPNITEEERIALKKREAAQARVQQRTMATFGLG